MKEIKVDWSAKRNISLCQFSIFLFMHFLGIIVNTYLSERSISAFLILLTSTTLKKYKERKANQDGRPYVLFMFKYMFLPP